MIVGNLRYDIYSLLACCLTCCSWYIAAAPHLHHTLITPAYIVRGNEKPWWPDSFRSMYKLGLFPLVKRFQVQGLDADPAWCGPATFSPELFDRRTLRQFSALINVRELGIDYLDIPSFMPGIQRYFGHFLPTVRSLALKKPKGSCRQIVFFIGLFQHLDDFKLLDEYVEFQEEPTDDLTLVPRFTPPLRGRLKLGCFTRVGILEDMITVFRGVRFRYVDLFDADGARLLLDACAKTLETLRLHPYDPHREQVPLKVTQTLTNELSVGEFPEDIDLSRNETLRTLEVTAGSISFDKAFILANALSTITSPVFSELVIVYEDYNFPGIRFNPCPSLAVSSLLTSYMETVTSRRHEELGVLREMCKIRDFRAVLRADVRGYLADHAIGELNRIVEEERAKSGSEGLSFQPLVTCCPMEVLPAPGEPMDHTVRNYRWIRPWAPPDDMGGCNPF